MHGLAMAKTYLQVNPEATIMVVDKARTAGGSWAKERLYPSLKTNNIFGSYEFGDMPMKPELYGEIPGGHIPGTVVHSYFAEAATRYKIDVHIRYDTNVDSATLQSDGRWKVQMSSTGLPKSECIAMADKLVVATGVTSEPYIPSITGMESFKGLILHSKQLKEKATSLRSCKRIVVLGGNKSAWDVCYSAARSGAQVHMVIRPSGGGPSYLWPKRFTAGPFTFSLASMSSSRFFMLFDPTPFGKPSLIRSLLHRTTIGAKICQFFWQLLDSRIRRLNGYNTHPEVKKLEPWTTPFWMGNSLSIHNYETDWFALVKEGKIRVHIADITSLSGDGVKLSDENFVKADALVCCTGWKADPTVKIRLADFTENIIHPKVSDAVELKRVEAEIYHNSPYLHTLSRRTPNSPSLGDEKSKTTSSPHQFYRLVVPWQRTLMEKKNLAFIGAHSSPHAVIVAQAQALWITAFFHGKVGHLQPPHVDFDAVRYDAILHSIYGRIRRPKETGGSGERFPDLVFDSIPYVDTLLEDLGLQSRRKRTWWKEMFEMYRPRDYRDIVNEWIEKELQKKVQGQN